MVEKTELSVPLQEPSQLAPKLDARWAISIRQMLILLLLSCLYLFVSYLPLNSPTLWGHLSHGQWIVAQGRLPAQDQLQHLAGGIQRANDAWLSEVILAVAHGVHGYQGLSTLFTTAAVASFVLLGRTFYCRSNSLAASVLMTTTVVVLASGELSALTQPKGFAFFCFALLLWTLQPPPASRADETAVTALHGHWLTWAGVLVCLIAWACLHTSSYVGFLFVACWCLGRVIDLAWRYRTITAPLGDSESRQWIYLAEFAAVVTVIPWVLSNWPRGPWVAGLRALGGDLLSGSPLLVNTAGGAAFVLSVAGLLVVVRHSPRRITCGELLLLATFAAASLLQMRLLTWYGVVFGFVVAPHLAAILNRSSGSAASMSNRWFSRLYVRSHKVTLLSALALWTAFAFSPASTPVLGGKGRTDVQLLGAHTPLKLTQFLRDNPPLGQVFNPRMWGDWLHWSGPPQIRLFVASDSRVTPRQVLIDYQNVALAQPGWQRVLDRYAVNTLIIDKTGQPALARVVREQSDFELQYEDEQCMVLSRQQTNGELNTARLSKH